MNIEELRTYCLSKDQVVEEFPFGPETLVFKVAGKVFAITGIDVTELSVNLKCEPEYAVSLREKYIEIIPGFHMNKKHWNTVDFEGSLKDEFLRSLIDHSYECVVKTFSKSKRREFGFE